MNEAESGVIDTLREIIDRRKIKVTALATATGIPYRSLQNYLRKSSRMPLATYLDVCKAIGVPPGYPVDRSFRLNHHALQQAIIDSTGSLLNVLEVDEDSTLGLKSVVGDVDEKHIRRVAGFLAAMIAGRYDVQRELELDEPLNDDGKVGQ